MSASLVGSEMCIRDRHPTHAHAQAPAIRANKDLGNGPAALLRVYEMKLGKQYRPVTLAESTATWPMVWSFTCSPLPATMRSLKTLALRTSSSHQN
eukprot:915218-Alexandrium_andersonii.AAC.1